MTTTYADAIDAMFAKFRTAWIAATAAIVAYVPEVRWPGVENPALPSTDVYWARVSQQTVIERQTTLSNDVGEPGKKRYTTSGLIFVQIFCPKSDSRAMERGRALAVVARNAFRGHTASGVVWFRNAHVNELPPEELALRFNVVAEYEYDELG